MLEASLCRCVPPMVAWVFLRAGVEITHRLYAVQGRDTSFRDLSSKGSIVQRTFDPRRNVRGRYRKGLIFMASIRSYIIIKVTHFSILDVAYMTAKYKLEKKEGCY
jgi:hypothetical protein